jgi:hypothetical protein
MMAALTKPPSRIVDDAISSQASPSPLARATTWPPGSAATPRTPNGSTASGLAIKTDLGSRAVQAWSIVHTAMNKHQAAIDLLDTGPGPGDLLADEGFNRQASAAAQAARGAWSWPSVLGCVNVG